MQERKKENYLDLMLIFRFHSEREEWEEKGTATIKKIAKHLN